LAAEAALRDPSPLVRMAALDAYQNLSPLDRRPAAPLLGDPSRVVRIQAARVLAPVAADALDGPANAAFRKAADEYVAAERFNADRPENRTNLGGFYADRGDYAASETEFRVALKLDNRFVPAWINLADLMRLQGREGDAASSLREGLAVSPDDPTLHHALGLSLVRQHDNTAALAELRRAYELAPGNARFAYVYGVAQHSSGKVREGIATLQKALSRTPSDRNLLSALASFQAEAGDTDAARANASRWLALYPDDRDARALVDSLQSTAR
jgi:Flp pilus assembly protein TadD